MKSESKTGRPKDKKKDDDAEEIEMQEVSIRPASGVSKQKDDDENTTFDIK